MAKQNKYLVVYDYGMGGLWAYIYSPSPDEIVRSFPFLQIMPEKPAAVRNDPAFAALLEENTYDIRDSSGWPAWLKMPQGKEA